MNALLALMLVAQLGDEVTPVNLQDWYKANERRPIIGVELRDGDVGILPYQGGHGGTHCETEILQVLSDDSALISFHIYTPKVIDNKFFAGSQRSQTATVMIRGRSTRGWADGNNIRFSGWFKVDGTESYNSAAGKRTVRVIRPFQNADTLAIDAELDQKAKDKAEAPAKAEAAAKAAHEEAEKKAAEQLRQSFRRTWKSRDGKFSVDAYFISQDTDAVTLERAADGKRITVPRSTLSIEDLDQARVLTLKKKSER